MAWEALRDEAIARLWSTGGYPGPALGKPATPPADAIDSWGRVAQAIVNNVSGANTILNGVGAPSDGLGADGDFYIDTAAWEIWGPKAAGTWVGTGPTPLEGPPGANGNTILNGSGGPSGGTGTDGDFYIDTAATDIYGPRAGGAWAGATSLIGPQGLDGIYKRYDLIIDTGNAADLEGEFADAGNAGKRILVLGDYTAASPDTVLAVPAGADVDLPNTELADYQLTTGEAYALTAGFEGGGYAVYNTSFTGANPKRITLSAPGFWGMSAFPAMSAGELAAGEWQVAWGGGLYAVASRDSASQITLVTGPNRIGLTSSVNRSFILFRLPPTGTKLSGRLRMTATDSANATMAQVLLGGYKLDTRALDLTVDWKRGYSGTAPAAVVVRAAASRLGPMRLDANVGNYAVAMAANAYPNGFWVSFSLMSRFAGLAVYDPVWDATISAPATTFWPSLVNAISCNGIHAEVDLFGSGASRSGGTTANTTGLEYGSAQYCTFRGSIQQLSAQTTLFKTRIGAAGTAPGSLVTLETTD